MRHHDSSALNEKLKFIYYCLYLILAVVYLYLILGNKAIFEDGQEICSLVECENVSPCS